MKKLLIILTLFSTINSVAQQLPDGFELINMMFDANKANWYKTLCFSQEVINYENDSIVAMDVWHEAYQSPGNLILKFTDWDSGDGILFTNDSIYTYNEGVLQSARYRIHDLVVLGLDINNIPPEITASRVEKCGYDLNKVNEVQLKGRDAWVVGDTLISCFWIDKETLLFMKMRRLTGENGREVEFARYESINGFPVATEIRFFNIHGDLTMVEKYFNITPDCNISSTIYNPKEFHRAKW